MPFFPSMRLLVLDNINIDHLFNDPFELFRHIPRLIYLRLAGMYSDEYKSAIPRTTEYDIKTTPKVSTALLPELDCFELCGTLPARLRGLVALPDPRIGIMFRYQDSGDDEADLALSNSEEFTLGNKYILSRVAPFLFKGNGILYNLALRDLHVMSLMELTINPGYKPPSTCAEDEWRGVFLQMVCSADADLYDILRGVLSFTVRVSSTNLHTYASLLMIVHRPDQRLHLEIENLDLNKPFNRQKKIQAGSSWTYDDTQNEPHRGAQGILEQILAMRAENGNPIRELVLNYDNGSLRWDLDEDSTTSDEESQDESEEDYADSEPDVSDGNSDEISSSGEFSESWVGTPAKATYEKFKVRCLEAGWVKDVEFRWRGERMRDD
jgi:hypothetical protein